MNVFKTIDCSYPPSVILRESGGSRNTSGKKCEWPSPADLYPPLDKKRWAWYYLFPLADSNPVGICGVASKELKRQIQRREVEALHMGGAAYACCRDQFRNPIAIAIVHANTNSTHISLRSHKLSGALAGCWSCSAEYDLRIVFDYVQHDGVEAILLLSLGTHDQVY